MLRLLIISDFTEAFPNKILEGIIAYSRRDEQWIICRMPVAYKERIGIQGVVDFALSWEADAVIGQFEETDEVELFKENGIVAVAQDFKKRFKSIPNLTGDYIGTGRMAARHFLERGFRNFGFFGLNDVCWSDERREGFRQEVEAAGFANSFHSYCKQNIDLLWSYGREDVEAWLKSLPKPVGIMACDDNQGINLIEACHVIGLKIPTEIAVIGVDNDELLCSISSTSLSSIQMDLKEGGYRLAQMIEERVSNPLLPSRDIVLHPIKIVGRLSTAAFATNDIQIRKAILFIHRNVMKRVSVSDVIKEVAMSRRLLERRFKEVTGQTVYQYISDTRIREFAELLLSSDESVTSLAMTLGETDPKSISRRFHQLYGCTPSAWRSKNKMSQL